MNKNKIKSKWNNIQVQFLLFPNTHQFQHSSFNTEQFPTSVIIAPAVIVLLFFCHQKLIEDCLFSLSNQSDRLTRSETVGTQLSSNNTNILKDKN